MRSVLEQITLRVREALERLGVEGDPAVQPAQDPRFGDYQSNAALAAAKRLGELPRKVAERLVDALEVADLSEEPEIAGPGFVNFRLRPDFLGARLGEVPGETEPDGERLGIPRAEDPEVVVVDLSSPNLAKEMHVGHLRSTVIGDSVARILEFCGHTVHRENHVGDWGTQFGMLVAYLREARPGVVDDPASLEIEDLESFYVEAKKRFDDDPAFKETSRRTVVELQQGDAATRRIWRAFCEESLRHCHRIYDRLGVRLEDRGESYYTELMDDIVARLEAMAAAGEHGVRESDGALCVFVDGFRTREGDPLPVIARKSDGGYNYATSDLATIVHRVEVLGATRVVYVVGIAQKQHFEMVFAAARQVGWVGPELSLEHLGFGNMLAASGRPFKTREGGTVKLKNLLDQAVERAREVAGDGDGAEEIAETVGLAAVRYFDLSHALQSDYKFDLDTMLAMDGNTAPYILYAYARIRSIGRKAGVDFRTLRAGAPLTLTEDVELELAKQLLRFPQILADLERRLRPNSLTDYLFELSKTFSRFYDRKLGVRVIDAPEPARASRLRLCEITSRVLRLGLDLLGIRTLERM